MYSIEAERANEDINDDFKLKNFWFEFQWVVLLWKRQLWA